MKPFLALLLLAASTSAATLQWAQPQGTLEPPTYAILMDGAQIASVAGTLREFRVDDFIAPTEEHTFQVVGIYGTESLFSNSMGGTVYEVVLKATSDLMAPWLPVPTMRLLGVRQAGEPRLFYRGEIR